MDEIVREAESRAKDDEKASYKGDALQKDGGKVAPKLQPFVDIALDDERVENGQSRSFDERREATENADQDNERHDELPFRLPERRACFLNVERSAGRTRERTAKRTIARHEHHEKQAGHDASNKEPVDRCLCIDAIEDHGQAWREEQADRS